MDKNERRLKDHKNFLENADGVDEDNAEDDDCDDDDDYGEAEDSDEEFEYSGDAELTDSRIDHIDEIKTLQEALVQI